MLRKKMAPLDISGDGSIDMEEFNEAVDLWVATRDRASRQSRIILGLVLLMLLLLGANFGLTYGVVHLAKDNEVKGSGVMYVKDSSTVVKTSSADFTISDRGSFRAASGSALSTASQTTTVPLSSRVPQAYLQAMTRIQLPVYSDRARGTQAMLSLSVSGYQRELDGSKLVLFAKSGSVVTVRGETITATTSVNGVLTTLEVVPEELRAASSFRRRRRRRRSLQQEITTEIWNIPLNGSSRLDGGASADTDLAAVAPAAGMEVHCSKSTDVDGNETDNCDACLHPQTRSAATGLCECPPPLLARVYLDEYYTPPLRRVECECPAGTRKRYLPDSEELSCEACPPGMVVSEQDDHECACPDGYRPAARSPADGPGAPACEPHSCADVSADHVSVGGHCVCPAHLEENADPEKLLQYDAARTTGRGWPAGTFSCTECGPNLAMAANGRCACALGPRYITVRPLPPSMAGSAPQPDAVGCRACPEDARASRVTGTYCECDAGLAAAAYEYVGLGSRTATRCAPCPAHAHVGPDTYGQCRCDAGYRAVGAPGEEYEPWYFRCAEQSCDRGMLLSARTGACECPAGQYLDAVTDECSSCAPPFVLEPTEDEGRAVCVCPEGLVRAGVVGGAPGQQTCARCGEGMVVRSHGHQRWCACREGFYEDPEDETVCRRCPDGLELSYDAVTGEPRCRCPASTRRTVVQRPGTFGRALEDYEVRCEPVAPGWSSRPTGSLSPEPLAGMSPAQWRRVFGAAPEGMDEKNEPITPVWVKVLLPRPTASEDLKWYADLGSADEAALRPTVIIGSRRPEEVLSGWIIYAFDQDAYLHACHKFGAAESTSPVPESDLAPGAAARGEYTLNILGLPAAGLIVLFKENAQGAYRCPEGAEGYGRLRLHEMQFFVDLEPETMDLHDKLLYESDEAAVDFYGLSKISEVRVVPPPPACARPPAGGLG